MTTSTSTASTSISDTSDSLSDQYPVGYMFDEKLFAMQDNFKPYKWKVPGRNTPKIYGAGDKEIRKGFSVSKSSYQSRNAEASAPSSFTSLPFGLEAKLQRTKSANTQVVYLSLSTCQGEWTLSTNEEEIKKWFCDDYEANGFSESFPKIFDQDLGKIAVDTILQRNIIDWVSKHGTHFIHSCKFGGYITRKENSFSTAGQKKAKIGSFRGKAAKTEDSEEKFSATFNINTSDSSFLENCEKTPETLLYSLKLARTEHRSLSPLDNDRKYLDEAFPEKYKAILRNCIDSYICKPPASTSVTLKFTVSGRYLHVNYNPTLLSNRRDAILFYFKCSKPDTSVSSQFHITFMKGNTEHYLLMKKQIIKENIKGVFTSSNSSPPTLSTSLNKPPGHFQFFSISGSADPFPLEISRTDSNQLPPKDIVLAYKFHGERDYYYIQVKKYPCIKKFHINCITEPSDASKLEITGGWSVEFPVGVTPPTPPSSSDNTGNNFPSEAGSQHDSSDASSSTSSSTSSNEASSSLNPFSGIEDSD